VLSENNKPKALYNATVEWAHNMVILDFQRGPDKKFQSQEVAGRETKQQQVAR